MATQQDLDGQMNAAIQSWAAGLSCVRMTCKDALDLEFAAQWPTNGMPPLEPPDEDQTTYQYAIYLTIHTAAALIYNGITGADRSVIHTAIFDDTSGSFGRVWPVGGSQPPPPPP